MEMEGLRKREARVFQPLALCFMWHLPQRWHLFISFDASYTGPLGTTFCQVTLYPGLQKGKTAHTLGSSALDMVAASCWCLFLVA